MMQQQQHFSVRNATRAAVNWAATPVGRLVRVEVLVTLSCALLTLLVFLGSGRRYSRNAAFRAVVWSALMLSYPAVSYTIGLMQSASFHNDLMVVWACFLLGCADGIAACSVDDSDQQARLLFNQAAQVIYVFLLLLSYAGSLVLELKILLFVFWVLTVAKLGLRLQRLLSVGRDRVLTVDNGLITKYMEHEYELSVWPTNHDDNRKKSYRYVVTGEENLQDEHGEFKLIGTEEESDIVTVNDVFRHSESFSLSVSFALFKLLRRRLTGSPQYELHESVVHKVRTFFCELLDDDGDQRIRRRRDNNNHKMYRIIEAELGFLFDFFYSRYPSHKQSLIPETIVFATAAALSMSSLFSSTLMHYGAMSSSNSVPIIATRFDIWLARLVIFMFLILEAFQFLSLVLSDWHRVKRLCRLFLHMRRDTNIVKGLLSFWLFQAWNFRWTSRRYWSNTVGQYSLLHACIRSEISRLWLPGWMRRSLIRTSITTHRHLPDSVKDAIANELKNSLPAIVNQQQIVYYEAECMTLEESSGGRVIKMRIPKPTIGNILILHIATTICGWKQQQADQVHGKNNNRTEAQGTASTISEYCAYLICYAPELITDNIYEAQLLLEGVQRRARRCLKDCHSEDDMYTKLASRFSKPKEEDDEYKAIVAQGVKLSELLTSKFPDEAGRWSLLAELWVKFLLSNVAPSNNIAAHVKRLASGGEFITHLWAFMTQGGFVKQPWVPCGDGTPSKDTQRDLEAGSPQEVQAGRPQDRKKSDIDAWTDMLERPED